MFSTLTNYFWGEQEDHVVPDCPVNIEDNRSEEGWILVDLTLVEKPQEQIQREKDATALPESVEESWYVTPPSCFDAGDVLKKIPESNPMEDLLIEHPSMSVYGPRSARSDSSAGSSSLSREPSLQADQRQALERRSARRTVRFQEQLDQISKRRLVEPPQKASIKLNSKNLKKQNNVHYHTSHSRRTKKRDRMVGKHVGMHGKRGGK